MTSPESRPTLQTIADRAGVSRSTVSLALRNQPEICAKTRALVQQIAEEIGYRPNPLVATLMTHLKTRRPMPDAGAIAFLTAFPTRDGWKQFSTFNRYYAGATQRAQQMGYRLDEIWQREPGMTARKMEKILLNRGVAGILLAPHPRGYAHVSLNVTQFCVATLGYSIVRPEIHRAATDHLQDVRTALSKLRHLGYRRIAMAILGEQDRRNNHIWSAGFLEYQSRLPASLQVPLFTLRFNQPQLSQWLADWKPDAVISGNAEIVSMVEKAGFDVPKSIGVAVLDRYNLDTNIAGIDQRPEIAAAAAIDLIVGQIQRNERGVPAVPKITLTGGLWIPGASVRRVADDAPASAKISASARRSRKKPALTPQPAA